MEQESNDRRRIIKLNEEFTQKLRSQVVITSIVQCALELIQNALDAGAKRIEINLKTSGDHLDCLSVQDDGEGIDPGDLKVVGHSHHTSKCSSVKDLDDIKTFGFRGEALASIAANSLLVISSRHKSYKSSYTIQIHNSNQICFGQDIQHQKQGTQVIVRNLFGNRPVRQKQLVLELHTAAQNLNCALRALALSLLFDTKARLEIDILLRTNNEIKFRFPPWTMLSDLLAPGTALVDFGYNEGGVELNGAISTEFVRGKDHQFIYINRRRLINKELLQDVNVLLQSSLPRRSADRATSYSRPAFVLWISAEVSGYELCQDPAKEIECLSNMNEISGMVLQSIRKVLQLHGFLPITPSPTKRARLTATTRLESIGDNAALPTVSSFRARLQDLALSRVSSRNCALGEVEPQPETQNQEWTSAEFGSMAEPPIFRTEAAEEEQSNDKRICKQDLQNAYVIGQVNKQFILIRISENMFTLVDQHAADERIRVERLQAEYCSSVRLGTAGVELSPPVPLINLTEHEQERLTKFSVRLQQWGFVVTSTKAAEARQAVLLALRVPNLVRDRCLTDKSLVTKFILDLVHEWSTGENTPAYTDLRLLDGTAVLQKLPNIMRKVINSRSCRGAVMFNDSLSAEQCQSIVRQLSQCSFPFQCAHGRPTLVPIAVSK
ncbi:uncharacterized protein V1516DRAFT_665467 [Lipomyces oligophaga]|uniref:uncharacterized protein n=1 Tax=Lipomyces oligophaga TaxID=45792 RepID=UPI0034CD9D78